MKRKIKKNNLKKETNLESLPPIQPARAVPKIKSKVFQKIRPLKKQITKKRDINKPIKKNSLKTLLPIQPTKILPSIKPKSTNIKKVLSKQIKSSKQIKKPITQNKKLIKEDKSQSETTDKTGLGVLETYNIKLDGTKVTVSIKKELFGTIYELTIPKIGVATTSLLNEIRSELISVTTINMSEIMDPHAFSNIKKRFMNEAGTLLKSKLPNIKQEVYNLLIGKLMQNMLGLGEIEFLINDPQLEEIVIPSSKEPIRVYHKKYKWLSTNLRVHKEDEIANYSNIIARRVGRQITVLTPLLDAHLVTGDRANAILYPISSKGNTITIRKFARDPYTIIDLISNKTLNIEIAALLWLAVEYEMNILISGGTASGKTVLLNICMSFIPPNHRIVSVEDTRELMLPEFLYWTPLVTRAPNPEGKGEISMLDLLINSLRMRPDRIILGEMRRQEEAMVLFEAMHTGHSVYATLHADSAAETISRLTNPPLDIPPNLLGAVNLNVVMFRDRKRGIRRVFQIAEFEAGAESPTANILYRWVPEQDKIIKHSETSRFFEDLTRHTGMSQTEINDNIKEKEDILSWLAQNKIRDLNDFGKVMNLYYTNKEYLITNIKKNDIKAVLGR